MLIGVLSDTHGVYDPSLAGHFAGCECILHAGDVGSHGGAAAVLDRLRPLAPRLEAIRGNVDDDAEATALLPTTQLLSLAGWAVLLVHSLADAAAACPPQPPIDIVICGHSHKFSVEHGAAAPGGGQWLVVNPGSAGPARFKLGRTAALLRLPPKGACAWTGRQRRGASWPAWGAPTLLAKPACALCRQRRAPKCGPHRSGAQGAATAARGARKAQGRRCSRHAAGGRRKQA